MYKLWMSVYKEFLLLKRDFGGLIILFVMPLVLIITITLIQDSTFRTVTESKIPVVLINNDNGEISKSVIENLNKSGQFEIVSSLDGIKLSENTAKEAVFKGKFQLAIIIPENLSKDLQLKVNQNVDKIISNFGIGDLSEDSKKDSLPQIINKKEVRLYFDPATQATFKSNVKSSIDKMISQIETKSIYATFQEQ
jgi:ABC-2 type transport system permease protein